MKNITAALILGFILFGCHYIFARLSYTDSGITDLMESEVREID